MSEENVEIARRLLAAIRQNDPAGAFAAAVDVLHPEIEMDTTRLPAPGLGGIYRGLGEVAGFWREWLQAWDTLGVFEDPELIDAGDQFLTWTRQQTMRGKGSGIEVEAPQYGWVMTVRDHKIVAATLYLDKAEALEAAGLSE